MYACLLPPIHSRRYSMDAMPAEDITHIYCDLDETLVDFKGGVRNFSVKMLRHSRETASSGMPYTGAKAAFSID